MKAESIPPPAVYRLSFYLRQLEIFQRFNRHTISSKQLGEALGYTDAQVRKDLACFGQFGHPGIGYRVAELIAQLKKLMGTDKIHNVLLVGVGNLGRALLTYKGFLQQGFRLIAAFDNDPAKINRRFGELQIRPLDELPQAVAEQHIQMAILAVPAQFAQAAADQLVAAGIRGILNFAPLSLAVPPHVFVQRVDLALQMEQLSFHLSLANLKIPAPASPPEIHTIPRP